MPIKTTGTESAYPCPVGHIECTHPTGLTKRELFAAMAMQGILANSNDDQLSKSTRQVAAESIEMADAVLTELNKQ